jgi:hypothetical protein
MAASAPTPQVNTALHEEHPAGVRFSAYQAPMDADILSKAVGSTILTRGNP